MNSSEPLKARPLRISGILSILGLLPVGLSLADACSQQALAIAQSPWARTTRTRTLDPSSEMS